jgi:hypothetical protein
VLQYQHRHMWHRLQLYKQLCAQRGGSIPVKGSDAEPAPQQQQTSSAPVQKARSSLSTLRDRLLCEMCESIPQRKKEVAIRWCGHAMCSTCVLALKAARNLHCPYCRISFSAPADLQWLVKCKASDLVV